MKKGIKEMVIEYIKDKLKPKSYAQMELKIIDRYGSYSDHRNKWTWGDNLNIITDVEDIKQILDVFYIDVDLAIVSIVKLKELEVSLEG